MERAKSSLQLRMLNDRPSSLSSGSSAPKAEMSRASLKLGQRKRSISGWKMVRRTEKGGILPEIREGGDRGGDSAFIPAPGSLRSTRAIKKTEKTPGSKRWR